MTEYNFDFNIDTSGMIRVSIMRLGIIFNSETIKALGSPSKINIGFDAKNKVLGIRPSIGNSDIKEYDFAKNGDEKWIRVNCKQIVEAIATTLKTKFENTARPFTARYDNSLQMLIVDLAKK